MLLPKKKCFASLLVCLSHILIAQDWAWIGGSSTNNAAPVYGSLGVASATNNPGARYDGISYTDNAGNFWLFGGAGNSTVSTNPTNDLWKYNPATAEWTWVSGSNTSNQVGVYGTMGVSSSSTMPGSRYGSIGWKDNAGNFWLFGGAVCSYTTPYLNYDYRNDLWKYDHATNQWTWMSGTTTDQHAGNYGTQGVPSATNIPRSRSHSVSWTDSNGDLWLFGGAGSTSSGGYWLNDLWKYSVATNEWTWVRGSNGSAQTGTYGVKGVPSSTTMPGARYGASAWTDNAGNLWLFGGDGFDATASAGLNDMWKYSPSTNQWTWMHGSSAGNQAPYYYNPSTNNPGSNSFSKSWSDNAGNLWIYGGSNTSQLWKYNLTSNQWTYVKGDQYTGYYYVFGIAHPFNKPWPSRSPYGWVDNCGNFYGMGGYHNFQYYNAMWKLNLTGAVNTSASMTIPQCEGLTTVLTATSAGGVSWYSTPTSTVSLATGSAYITPTLATGTYTWYAEAGSCTITPLRTAVVVTVNPLPVLAIGGATTSCSTLITSLSVSGASSYTWSNGALTPTIFITPTVTTTYSVTGILNGCTNTSVKVLTVIPLPTLSVIAPTANCSGNTFTASVSGATSYSWSTGQTVSTITASPLTNASYTAYGTSNGCTAKSVFSVAALPLPNVTVNSGSVCAGSPFTFTPAGGVSYVITGGSYTVSPPATTVYSLSGTGSNGCIKTVTASVLVEQLPVISIPNGTLCYGDAITLVPSGASTYTVSGGTFTVSPLLNTSYSVTGTSSAGCVSSNAAVATVTVHTRPVISVNSGSICPGQVFTIVPSGAATYTVLNNNFTVTPVSSATYIVAGTSSLGCVSASTALSSVFVHPQPVITVNSGTLCAGSIFTLVPSGAVTYTYSSGTNTIAPFISGSYSVTGTSSLGCISALPGISNVTVFALPIVSAASGSICAGGIYTITPSGAASYTYSSGSPTVSPVQTTPYLVTGTSANGCISSAPAIVVVTVNPLPVITANSGSICSGQNFLIIPAGAATYSYSGGTALVSPLTNTFYTVTGTSPEGCLSAAAAVSNVTVMALPVVTVNSGTICAGKIFTIIPSGAISYTISGNSNTVSPVVSTTYSVQGSAPSGCISSNVISYVSVLAAPSVTLSSFSSTICAGESVTITAAGANAYNWSNGGINDTIVVSPAISTAYTATGTAMNGCQVTVNFLQSVDACTGLSGNKDPWQVRVYPNPSHGQFYINSEEDAVVTITDNPGRVILKTTIGKGANAIKLDGTDKGIYFLKIIYGSDIVNRRMIIE